jgi:CshA-type fibril repeat protein
MTNYLRFAGLLLGLVAGARGAVLAAPTAVADVATTAGRTPITFSITANDTGTLDLPSVDLDGNASNGIRVTSRSITNQGTFVVDDAGNLTFTPLSTFTGITTAFSYYVRDTNGAPSNAVTVRVTVGPLTTDDVMLITYQTARTFRPTTNDVVASSSAFNYATLDLDLSQAGVQSQRTLAEGSLVADPATGDVTFTPVAGYSGDVPAVTYTISDQSPAPSSTGTIRLRVGGRPFVCTGEFYQISQPGTTANLYRLSRSTNGGGQITYTASQIYSTGTTMNGLCLSGQDGYLYAIGTASPFDLFQLSQDGVRNLGKVPGLPTASGFNSATADNQGNLYFANNTTSTLYRVDLKTFTSSAITLSQSVKCGDIAFNPATGLLYTSRYPNDLYSIDLASASATKPVTVLATASSGDDMGSLFFDASGTLYGAGNAGNFYLYDLGTGQSTNIGPANTATQGDGASCAFPTEALDVVKSVGTVVRRTATVYDVPYTIRVRNTSAGETPNVQINEFLYSTNGTNTTFPGAVSVVIYKAPTVTGDLPASAANAAFTGQGSATGLLLGTAGLQAGQTATITFTARVTYSNPGQVPAQAYNTAYASTATVRPNSGYQMLADGSLISPDQVLDVDRSTNSSTLPASRKADTPGATPANFDTATPLPVTLREFTAQAVGTAAHVAWSTASEVRNDRFEVERSADGQQFKLVGAVPGHGTSTTGFSYGLVDEDARRFGTQLYYRLRQVDADGEAAYSPVRTVQFGGTAPLALYPNPARTTATLDLTSQPAGTCAVAIYDLTGRLLAQYALAGGQAHTLDVRALPTGISLVRVNGQMLRFAKEE